MTHPIMTWLVSRAADVRTFRVRDRVTQRSAYQMAKGRSFSTRLLGFGESCRFKLRAHEGTAVDRPLERWGDGVFLGICKRTGQYKVYSEGQRRFARTIMRKADQFKWDVTKLQAVGIATWQNHRGQKGEVIPSEQFNEGQVQK